MPVEIASQYWLVNWSLHNSTLFSMQCNSTALYYSYLKKSLKHRAKRNSELVTKTTLNLTTIILDSKFNEELFHKNSKSADKKV